MKLYLLTTVVLHLANRANALLSDTTWQCAKTVHLNNFTCNVDKAKFGVGDCLLFHPDDQPYYEKFANSSRNFTSALPKAFKQFPNNSFGVFIAPPESECGGKMGLKLLSVSTAPVKEPIKPTITCPAGKVPVQTVPSSGENKCTTKYGSANHQWEQDGLLCYPKCKSGYYGVAPVCWAHCPQDTTDGGVFCTKSTYAPHTRAVWPWSQCNNNEFQYGFECITKCKAGYNKYWAVAMYYCGAECGPNTIDAGLTCTKKTYGRGAGKLAVPVWEFSLIVAASIVGAAAIAIIGPEVLVAAVPEAADTESLLILDSSEDESYDSYSMI